MSENFIRGSSGCDRGCPIPFDQPCARCGQGPFRRFMREEDHKPFMQNINPTVPTPEPDPAITPAPKGLTSRKEWDRQRLTNILNAISRFAEAGRPVPSEWVTEAKELAGLKQ